MKPNRRGTVLLGDATIVSFEEAMAARGAERARVLTDEELNKRQRSLPLSSCHVALDSVSFAIRNKTRMVPLFNNLSVAFPKGRRISILGHKGSGKSVLVDLLIGQSAPLQGKVYRTTRLSWPVLNVGFIDRRLTMRQNALFMAGVLGLDSRRLLDRLQNFCEIPDKQLHEPAANLRPHTIRRMGFVLYIFAGFDCHVIDGPLKAGLYDVTEEQAEAMRGALYSRDYIATMTETGAIQDNCDLAYILYDGRLYMFDDVLEAIHVYHSLPVPVAPAVKREDGEGNEDGDEAVQELF